MKWSDWNPTDGLIYVSSRGPHIAKIDGSIGNGGITAIASALNRCFPNTSFIHKGTHNGSPWLMVTSGHESTPDDEGGLDQTTVSLGRWLSSSVMWFGWHSDWKNCDGYQDLNAWVEAQNDDRINPVNRGILESKYEEATKRYDAGWEAMAQVNRQTARVIFKAWKLKPRPIMINDFDNCMVPKFLLELDPGMAEWILYMHHIPIPQPNHIPSFYAKYFHGTVAGILASGIRFVGLHTPRFRRRFGQLAEESGGEYAFEESTMRVSSSTGRITRLGQTLAGVDRDYFREKGKQRIDIAQLTGLPWMANMKYIARTDRGDDPQKNGRRVVEVIDEFFINPDSKQMKGKMAFVVIGCPSRQGIAVYDSYLSNWEKMVEDVNRRHRQGDWVPIVVLKKVFSSEVIAGFYGHPNCLGAFVASKEDGLHQGGFELAEANYHKLDYVESASSTDESPPAPGVLWLSISTGAYDHLGHHGAIHINPRDVKQMARALWQGITMSPEERRFRLEELLVATAPFDISTNLMKILRHAGLPLPSAESIDQHSTP